MPAKLIEWRPYVRGALLAAALTVIALAPVRAGSLDASDVVMPPTLAPHRPEMRRYWLEFRARPDNEFGHVYMVLEADGPRGRRQPMGLFGFSTATGFPGGLFSLLGAPGEIGYSRDDLTVPPTAVYRAAITPAHYLQIAHGVPQMRETWTYYQLLFVNCNTLAGAIARAVGLKAPDSDLMFPEDYVRALAALNTPPAAVAAPRP